MVIRLSCIPVSKMPFIGGAGATTAVVYPKAGCFDQTDPSLGFDRADRSAHQQRAKIADDGFDFGQFGHWD